MKRPFSPLVWLCAVGALSLSALVLCDPSGVYAEYVGALDRDTPVIAAAFTAAQSGVYPWSSRAEAGVLPGSPAYRPITETVTDEEMRSSVGNDEPFSESVPPSPNGPIPAAPSAEPSAGPAAPAPGSVPDGDAGTSADAPAAAEAPQVFSGFVTVDESWFNDALFIGDSHIEGLCDYGGLPNATYYFKRGLDIWSVLKKSFVGGKLTIPQALSERQFGKIYIMLGINEIGCGTTESYAAQYADVVARLRELQPNAVIYIQAIFHTSQKKSDSSIYNNDTINARNAAISALADGRHVFFVDCNAIFDDENGALTSSYSGDGVHVKAPYYTMWRDYLFRFGLSGVAAADVPVEQDTVSSAPAPVPARPSEPTPSPAGESAAEQPADDTAAESEPPVGEGDVPEEPVPALPESDPDVSDADPDPDAPGLTSDPVPDADPAGVSASADAGGISATAPGLPQSDAPSAADLTE